MLLRSSNPNTSDDKRCCEPSYAGKSAYCLGVERPLKGANAEEYLDINRFFLLPMPFEVRNPLYAGRALFQPLQELYELV